jgi:hypothetical protein
MDLSGRVIYSAEINGTQSSVDLTGYAKGTYFLMLNDNRTTVSKHLIIKK